MWGGIILTMGSLAALVVIAISMGIGAFTYKDMLVVRKDYTGRFDFTPVLAAVLVFATGIAAIYIGPKL